MGVPLSRSPGNGCLLRSLSMGKSSTSQVQDFVLMPSRYQEEFEELNLIGYGGFGRVYQV